MRLLRLAVLLVATVGFGCASNQTAQPPAEPEAAETVTADKVCGDPPRFPISKECIEAIGPPYRSLLQQKSVLVMEVWRYCPSSNPCLRFDACRKLTGLDSSNPQFKAQLVNCTRAQQEDYSCTALQDDADYKRQQQATDACLAKMLGDRSCFPDSRARSDSKVWKSKLAHQKACWDRCLSDDSTVAACTGAEAALAEFDNWMKGAMQDAGVKRLLKPSEPALIPASAESPNSIE